MRRGFHEVPISRVREFWNARPCNIRHSPRTVGERAYFDEVEARKYFVEPHIPGFAEFERWKGKSVLEIGCGIGTDTVNFARAGARVVAVDLSDRSLEITLRRLQVYGLENVKLVAGDVERLQQRLPIEHYDLVYAFGVLHHTPDPDAALRQLRPYVSPSGSIKLMLYHRYSWKVLTILLQHGVKGLQNLDEVVARHSEAQTGCPVTYTYTRRGVRRWLEDNGFTVQDLFIDHIFPWRVSDYVSYRYARVWYFEILPRSLFRSLERHAGWHLCVTATPQ
jgi:2-polyprenyl-3-methyl-5-hydroxy-6-metoxy-1,4-benzoquinol methylase